MPDLSATGCLSGSASARCYAVGGSSSPWYPSMAGR